MLPVVHRVCSFCSRLFHNQKGSALVCTHLLMECPTCIYNHQITMPRSNENVYRHEQICKHYACCSQVANNCAKDREMTTVNYSGPRNGSMGGHGPDRKSVALKKASTNKAGIQVLTRALEHKKLVHR